ncbi:MAG: HEPN domain-containing protein [Terriglobia bacterium]
MLGPIDYSQRLDEIDRQMTEEGVPVHSRAIRALLRILEQDGISADIFGPACAPLLDNIQDWYSRRYGDRALVNFTIGEKPFMLRGLVYFLTFPTVYGRDRVEPLKFVEGLTDDMARSLTQKEHQHIVRCFLAGYHQVLSLKNLGRNPGSLGPLPRDLVERGLQDIRASVSVLKNDGNVQGAIFHAHEAVEKFMKATLARYDLGEEDLKKEFRHDLAKALDALKSKNRKFEYLEPAVRKVNLPSMDIRYAEKGSTAAQAVEAVDSALHICSFISDQWQLDEERKGADPALEPGKFYRNSWGLDYRCIKIEKDADGREVAEMAMLDNQGVDAIFTQKRDYAFLYAEITDLDEIKHLDRRYRTVFLGQQETEGP